MVFQAFTPFISRSVLNTIVAGVRPPAALDVIRDSRVESTVPSFHSTELYHHLIGFPTLSGCAYEPPDPSCEV